MPLRDHFHGSIPKKSSWEGFHGGWPMAIVQRLTPRLPEQFVAEPRVHLGAFCEVDVCTFENEPFDAASYGSPDEGGLATAVWAPPKPTLIFDAELPDPYEYEVLVYDQSRGRQLVAAVEIVSPANKDRPENRRAFVTKCVALLQQGVCVSLVDLVTSRHFNLYLELLDTVGHAADPTFAPVPPAIYAVTLRQRRGVRHARFESWAYPLVIGQPLPTLPLWLADDLAVSLELEASYEETCRALRIA